MIARIALAMVVGATAIPAQERAITTSGPTILAARAAFSVEPAPAAAQTVAVRAPESCGSMLRNALLLGLGFSLATASLELVYTLVREPFVRSGHDLARADPEWIAWAGGAGFVVGLVGTAVCRRRHR